MHALCWWFLRKSLKLNLAQHSPELCFLNCPFLPPPPLSQALIKDLRQSAVYRCWKWVQEADVILIKHTHTHMHHAKQVRLAAALKTDGSWGRSPGVYTHYMHVVQRGQTTNELAISLLCVCLKEKKKHSSSIKCNHVWCINEYGTGTHGSSLDIITDIRAKESLHETHWRVCINKRHGDRQMVSTLLRMHSGIPFIFFTLGYYFTN